VTTILRPRTSQEAALAALHNDAPLYAGATKTGAKAIRLRSARM
jgi:hypothetical protein